MITAKVYDGSNPATLIAEVTERRDPTWVEILNETGYGSIKVHERDAVLVANPSLVNYDNIVRLAIDGTDLFAFVVEGRGKPPAPTGEHADRWWTLEGRGVLALLSDAIVYPERAGTAPKDRTFGWMAIAYDDSAWTSAVALQRQDDTGPVTGYVGTPQGGWPDPTAYWIWSSGFHVSDGYMDPGTSYFRKSFTVADDTLISILITCDNAFRLWVDDEMLIDNLTADASRSGWVTLQQFNWQLLAGDHLIAVEAVNETLASGFYGPAALIVTVVVRNPSGTFGSVIVNTDDTWLALDYPAEPPGMTCGEIIRVLLDEAQARGALSGITLGFDDASDSNSAYWDVLPDIAFQVGSSYLDVMKVLTEQYLDVRMGPDLVLSCYNTGTLGSDLTGSVSLQIGKDFEELSASGEEPIGATLVSNVVLARDQTGALSEHTETTSLAGHKRKESYVEMGTAPSVEQAARASAAVFIELSLPSVQLQGKVTKASGPYTAWEVGDIIDVPDLFLIPVDTLVLSLSVSEDEAGNEIYTIQASQDDTS